MHPAEPDDGLQGSAAIEVQEVGADETLAADVEQAAVLYANGQAAVARSVLESAVGRHRGAEAERLWLMLFDLYALSGTREAFEALAIDFARTFEKSPPAWRGAEVTKGGGTETVVLHDGVSADDAALSLLEWSLDRPRVRVDCRSVTACDAAACARLLGWFREARRRSVAVEIVGDRLATALAGRIRPGERCDPDCWLLYLELLQRLGRQAAFEEAAVDYAVTFEVSPPSWEDTGGVADAIGSGGIGAEELAADSFPLTGEVRNARFAELATWAEGRSPVVVDLAAVTRIDFLSAGALFNTLAPLHRAGARIVLRHPNQLVAELLNVVGIGGVASIVPPKR